MLNKAKYVRFQLEHTNIRNPNENDLENKIVLFFPITLSLENEKKNNVNNKESVKDTHSQMK